MVGRLIMWHIWGNQQHILQERGCDQTGVGSHCQARPERDQVLYQQPTIKVHIFCISQGFSTRRRNSSFPSMCPTLFQVLTDNEYHFLFSQGTASLKKRKNCELFPHSHSLMIPVWFFSNDQLRPQSFSQNQATSSTGLRRSPSGTLNRTQASRWY